MTNCCRHCSNFHDIMEGKGSPKGFTCSCSCHYKDYMKMFDGGEQNNIISEEIKK